MRVAVTVTHLELRSPSDLRPKAAPRPDVTVNRVAIPMPELNRFFYSAVGGNWYWIDRLRWTYDEWKRYLSRQELETWVINVAGTPAGYFELERQPGSDVEIVYFGLLPAFTGSGLGGWALTETTRRAWAMGAKRVWVHTCNLDHPGALANYRARGFDPFKVETNDEDLPDEPPGPWPGAGSRT